MLFVMTTWCPRKVMLRILLDDQPITSSMVFYECSLLPALPHGIIPPSE